MYGFNMTEIDPFDFTFFINWLGLFGNIFAIIFFIAPINLIIKLHNKELHPEKTPYLIMTMNIMNCFLWLSFGYLIDDFFIMLGNGIGYPLNLLYLSCFFYYYMNRKLLKSLLLIIPAILISGGLFLLLIFVIKDLDISKYSAMFFNILMFGAPGQKIIEVFQKEDYTLIPLPNTLLGFLCSMSWMFYGILKPEISIIIPNALGVLFSIINLGTYTYFYSKSKRHPLLEDVNIKEHDI